MSDAPPLPAELERPAETQWSIVRRMFRRRRTAVWGLRGASVLVLIAIYAPVICSGLPLVWQEPGGERTYPWLRQLFDTNYWSNAVDRFFNMLMLVVTAWALVRLVAGFVVRDKARRAAVRGVIRKGAIGVGFALLLLQVLGAGFLESGELYRVYRDDARGYERAGQEHTAVFTLVPYGHREYPNLTDHRYLGLMTEKEGEFHLLGTDKVGRDVFARLIYGTRISLTVGLVAVAIYVTIGTILGAIAGFKGGRIDLVIMRIVEIVICIPGLFLILTIIALFGSRSIFMIMFAIGLVAWTGIARLVRGEFIRERSRDYVAAARSLGLSGSRILFRHVLPNAIAPVIVAATFGVAGAIITESTLTFLGLGDVNVPSWGMLLNEGKQDVEWHMILSPGVAIFLTVTLLNLVGDGLRDALDPKLRQ